MTDIEVHVQGKRLVARSLKEVDKALRWLKPWKDEK